MNAARRCLLVLAVIAVGVASLVGCDSQRATAPPSTPAVIDDPASQVPAADTALKPTPAATATDVKGTESTAWRLVSVSKYGLELEVRAVTGDGVCWKAAGWRVQQDHDAVELTALIYEAHHQAACPTSLTLAQVTLDLDSPLGDRHLLHAPVSPDWPQIP